MEESETVGFGFYLQTENIEIQTSALLCIAWGFKYQIVSFSISKGGGLGDCMYYKAFYYMNHINVLYYFFVLFFDV